MDRAAQQAHRRSHRRRKGRHQHQRRVLGLSHRHQREQPARERRGASLLAPLLAPTRTHTRGHTRAHTHARTRAHPHAHHPHPPVAAGAHRTLRIYSLSLAVGRQRHSVPCQQRPVTAKAARRGRRRGGRTQVGPPRPDKRKGRAAGGREVRDGVGASVGTGVGAGVGVGGGGGVRGVAANEEKRWWQGEGSEVRGIGCGRRVAELQR